MFDVGFLELAVIMILGLLVLGPERLPKAARTVGYWFGKARRYVEGMKSQVEAEFDTTEVKRLLHNQEVQIRELQSKITETGSQVNNEYTNIYDDLAEDELPHTDHEGSALDANQIDSQQSSPQQENSGESPAAAGPKYDIIEDDADWGVSELPDSSAVNESESPEEQPLDKAQ